MTEPTYYVLKREACEHCLKGWVNLTPEMAEAINRGDALIPISPDEDEMKRFFCPNCNGQGVIDSHADLIEVLEKLTFFLDTRKVDERRTANYLNHVRIEE